MSKKPPKAKKKPASRAELIEARVLREQQWIYEKHLAGHPKPTIRAMSLEPVERGGLGRSNAVSFPEMRAAIAEIRTSNGEIIGTKAERVERYTLRYEEQIELALAARSAAAAENRIDYEAEKLLASAQTALAKLHGDDAATKIEAEVTTRDGVLDELNEALAALDLPTVDKVT